MAFKLCTSYASVFGGPCHSSLSSMRSPSFCSLLFQLSYLSSACPASVVHDCLLEFPGAKVTGTDLSPHFLAVAELEESGKKGYREKETGERVSTGFQPVKKRAGQIQCTSPLERHIREGGARRVNYMHDKAEDSVLESSSVDLMSFQPCSYWASWDKLSVN
eukprot:1138850-Pelagomonas_calceolata.AAC.3